MAINAGAVFSSAQQFHSFEMIGWELLKKVGTTEFVIPSAVVGAFSFELYLKCLIILDTGRAERSEHDYWKLFKKLTPATQTEVKLEYDKLPLSIEEETYPLMEETKHLELTFDAILKRSADAFITFRYLFEGRTGGSASAPSRIRRAVIIVIRKRHPEWQLLPNCNFN